MRARRLFWTALGAALWLLPTVALACPTCGASQENSSAFWKLLLAFLLTPPAIGFAALWFIRKQLRG